jgi:hypothetical protein
MMFKSTEEELCLLREQVKLLEEIAEELKPKLAVIKIAFQRKNLMAEGPITLQVGQSTVATLDGFDQNGNPYTGTIPTPVWTIDQPNFDSIAVSATNASAETVTSLAVGVANLTATVTLSGGLNLSDTEAVTNIAVAPILSSIKINFAAPTGV